MKPPFWKTKPPFWVEELIYYCCLAACLFCFWLMAFFHLRFALQDEASLREGKLIRTLEFYEKKF